MPLIFSSKTIIGDDSNNDGFIDGVRLKAQILTAEAGYDSYKIYGDLYILENGQRGANDTISGISLTEKPLRYTENVLYGDSEVLQKSFGGNDKIYGGDNLSFNYMFGDAALIEGGVGGNDYLKGGSATNVSGQSQSSSGIFNVICGDAALLNSFSETDGSILVSRGGNDVLIAGGSNSGNSLYGDAQTMTGGAIGGNDLLAGSDSRNYGGLLVGDAYFADENATGGNDRLISGAASEVLCGDFYIPTSTTALSSILFGNDTFVFKIDNGGDVISDFGYGKDKIEISGIAGIDDFSDLVINQIDGSSVIQLSEDDSVTVMGVLNLTAENFIFS